jgi:hypothetical protein
MAILLVEAGGEKLNSPLFFLKVLLESGLPVFANTNLKFFTNFFILDFQTL